jgi:hypothetical protein
MRKLLLILALIMGGASFTMALAGHQIPMQIIKETGVGNGSTLAPPRPWYMIQDGFTLTMPAFEDDFTLELLDEDGVVVYSAYVPAGTTQIVLPSTLSGDFELRLVADTYYYRGYISL